MNRPDPRTGLPELRAAMIRAARQDAPPPDELKKRMVAMGLAPLGIAATSATATAGTWLSKLLWPLIGMVGGLAVIGISQLARVQAPPVAGHRESPSVSVSSGAPVAPSVASETAPETSSPAPTIHPVAMRGSAAPAASPSLSASAPVASEATPNLARETQLLDEARRAIARGEPDKGLESLNQYAAECKDAQLRDESTAIRVQALAAGGKCAEARTVGQSFLRQHARSAQAPRIRALMESCQPVDSIPAK